MKAASLVLLFLMAVPGQAQDPPPTPTDAIHVPEVQPIVPPTPAPGTRTKLAAGQWYVVDYTSPLLVDAFSIDGGEVTIVPKKGPLSLPASVAVDRKPDKDDPDFVTIPGPYVYLAKAKVPGTVLFDIAPALNAVDKDGKQIPLTRAVLVRRMVDVLSGPAPVPPGPTPIPPGPTPVDPFTKAVIDAYAAETDPLKATQVAMYNALYMRAATSFVNDPSVKTVGDLKILMQANDPLLTKDSSGKILPATTLLKVRKVVADYERPLFGDNTNPLDRTKAAVILQTVSQALGKVGG